MRFKKIGATLALSAVLFSAFSSTGAVSSASAATNVTSSYSKKMRTNALHMAYYAYEEKKTSGSYPVGTGKEFASKVRSGGPWDYKHSYTGTYTFNGKTSLKGEDLGNMHYGYVGRAAGFSATILKSAAGWYQIHSGTSYKGWYKSYYDDPNDQKWIKYGISLWDNNSLPKAKSLVASALIEQESASDILSAPLSFDELTDAEKESIKQQVIADAAAIKDEEQNGTTKEEQIEDINKDLEGTGVTVSQ